MAMQDDIAWFEQNRPMIASTYPGMFVIVKDRAVVGAYPDYASAYSAGTAMFGTEEFLVKEAIETQPVETLTQMGRRRYWRSFPGLGQIQDAVERLRQDGAIVQVQIQVPESYAAQLQARGQSIPPAQVVRGMIDTGASISTVSEAVATAAGLQQVGSVPIGGVGGMSTRPIYSTYFGLPEYDVAVDPIEVASVNLPVGAFDVLLGRDVLKALQLTYTGPHGLFALTQEVGAQPQAPGGPTKLPSTKGLSTPALIGIGAGAAALIAGTLFALGVFEKK
jgi:aspartyl protease